jgi:hypothetical protein
MDNLIATVRGRLEQLFPNADIIGVGPVEYRSATLTAYADTAPELEGSALKEAREFFGDGPELRVKDGWEARASDRRPLLPGQRYHADVTVHAIGPLAAVTPEDIEPLPRRRYPAQDVPGPDTLPEPEGKREQHSDQDLAAPKGRSGEYPGRSRCLHYCKGKEEDKGDRP